MMLFSLSSFILMIIMVLMTIPFITLMEQKILSSIQIRVGPNYVSFSGLLQPFADAVKLFMKETSNLRFFTASVFFFSPVTILTISLMLWLSLPMFYNAVKFKFSTLFFLCMSSFMVYPILAMGWSSNSKYSILGAIRTTAQIISYEVSLIMILLSIIWVTQSMEMKIIMTSQIYVNNMMIFLPVGMMWLVSTLAETNRTPFDFSEGESELVSGFNTEFSAENFTLIFIAEYSSILFMSALFVILFLTSSTAYMFMFKTLMITFILIWVRGVLPRFRYDKLMSLAWKTFLPLSIFLFSVYFTIYMY